jgi:GTP cyclohydrolase I
MKESRPLSLLNGGHDAELNEVNPPAAGAGKHAKLLPAQLAAIAEATRTILHSVGEDPERDGLQRTPQRVARMYAELLAGYGIDPQALINGALFDVDYEEMVVVRDIEFSSLCEHHMLPFTGHAHVAYIPNGKVLGLSKIPRIVDMYAQPLQVQERLTTEIADFMVATLQPQGVAVVLEAAHMCAQIRGVRKHDARMVTSALRGTFRDQMGTRLEFMQHINMQRPRAA